MKNRKSKSRLIIYDQRMISLWGPRDASAKRVRFVERVLTTALRDTARAFNHDKFPQMKRFKITVDG